MRTFTPRRIATLLCVLAFALRVAAILVSPGHFWAYTVYYEMAQVVVTGGGYCISPGVQCAYFPPLYPTLLAAGILTGHPRAAIIVLEALIGSGTVWMTWLCGKQLFGESAGLLAAACAALYPYFVWHDAVVQETGLLTFTVTLAVYLLLLSHNDAGTRLPVAAGAALALGPLTKANLVLFVPAALLWMALFSAGNRARRIRRCLLTAAGFALLLGPWIVRTWAITGSPVIYTNGGFALWTSNQRLTFDYYPEQSIDEAHVPEFQDLSPADRHELETLPRDPHGLVEARWYWNKGVAFILAHPGLTLRRDLRKIAVAFSPIFSPRKGTAFETLYFASYFPVLVFAFAGVWRSRARWRELGYLYVLIVTFALGSAVLWAHTSHRMYLEPCLMVLAAGAATQEDFLRYFQASRGPRSTG